MKHGHAAYAPAWRLVRAKEVCPEAVFLKGNYEHYRAVSQYLQDVYLNYTTVVEFTSLDDAYLSI